MKDKIFWLVLVGGLLAYVIIGRQPATSAEQASDGKPEIIAATFSSAWCSACKIMKPRVTTVMEDFADRPVKFVELNFTFGQRTEVEEIAIENGFAPLYQRMAGATGFTVLIDKDSGAVIDTLTASHSTNAMRDAIENALAIATYSDEKLAS